MNSAFLGPEIISAVVTRFFWPPLMPLIMALPTCMHQVRSGSLLVHPNQLTAAAQAGANLRLKRLAGDQTRLRTRVSAQTLRPKECMMYSVRTFSRLPSS